MSILSLLKAVNDSFEQLGVHMDSEETANEVVVTMHIPRPGRAPLVIAQREPVPSDAVGAVVGAKHKLRKKLKKAVKKVAHSKILKTLARTALSATPGGKQLQATAKAARALKKAIKKSKHPHPAVKRAAESDAADAHEELQAAVAPGGGGNAPSFDGAQSDDDASPENDGGGYASASASDLADAGDDDSSALDAAPYTDDAPGDDAPDDDGGDDDNSSSDEPE